MLLQPSGSLLHHRTFRGIRIGHIHQTLMHTHGHGSFDESGRTLGIGLAGKVSSTHDEVSPRASVIAGPWKSHTPKSVG